MNTSTVLGSQLSRKFNDAYNEISHSENSGRTNTAVDQIGEQVEKTDQRLRDLKSYLHFQRKMTEAGRTFSALLTTPEKLKEKQALNKMWIHIGRIIDKVLNYLDSKESIDSTPLSIPEKGDAIEVVENQRDTL